MKQIIYITMLLATALALFSCEKQEEQTSSFALEKITFNLSIETDSVKTRSSNVNRYIIEVYETIGGVLTPVNCFENKTTHRAINSRGEFSTLLDKTKTYTCLFWADDTSSYNADELQAVKLNSSRAVAIAYCANVTLTGLNQNKSIELKRAVAQVKLIENGSNVPQNNITATYRGYDSFNVFTSSVIGNSKSFSHTFSKYAFSGNNLGSFVALANHTSAGTVIDITIKESSTNATKTIRNTKLRANSVTNLRGHFFDLPYVPEPECGYCGSTSCDGECQDCRYCGSSYCDGECQNCGYCGSSYCDGECQDCGYCGSSSCDGECQDCRYCGSSSCDGDCRPTCDWCGSVWCSGECTDGLTYRGLCKII